MLISKCCKANIKTRQKENGNFYFVCRKCGAPCKISHSANWKQNKK